jgi:hypothetical protein
MPRGKNAENCSVWSSYNVFQTIHSVVLFLLTACAVYFIYTCNRGFKTIGQNNEMAEMKSILMYNVLFHCSCPTR